MQCKRAFRGLEEKLDVNRFYEDRATEIVLDNTVDARDVREVIKDFEVEVVDTGFAIHIKPKNTDKGKALLKVCKMIGLEASDFLAIGDSVNDVGLLDVAELGVAVGNSNPRLKETADKVLEQKDGEGVEKALMEFLDYE
ncbi:hypothetical protein C9439_02810 [archaeon SCG-AAA382B04]|nr:hypothetical protein C9439_02810 [archaeon SCG-AAA382B04]